MQKSFDEDWASGSITYTGWHENASDSGILGFKMLAQTGNENYLVNKSQVRSVRLVDDQGIIRPEVFYNFLTVWYNVDTMGYTASQVGSRYSSSKSILIHLFQNEKVVIAKGNSIGHSNPK